MYLTSNLKLYFQATVRSRNDCFGILSNPLSSTCHCQQLNNGLSSMLTIMVVLISPMVEWLSKFLVSIPLMLPKPGLLLYLTIFSIDAP